MFSASAKTLSILQLIFGSLSLIGIFIFSFNCYNILLVLLGYFLYSGIGVSMTMHRYFSHKSFEFRSKFLERFCVWFAILAGRGSPLGWVYVHRMHHTHSDTDLDPHDPKTVGWKIFFPHIIKYGEKINKRVIRDMLTTEHVFINTHYLWFIIGWSLLLLLISPELLYFFYILPFTLSYIALDLFVLLTHKYGYRNHDTKDNSRNNWFISIILWGEGWHNNHHRYPHKHYLKEKIWEIDILGKCIQIIKK